MQPAELAAGARRILVIRLGALGDVVRTRFAFAGLRARCPEARIDWLVDDRSAAGLTGIAGLDAVIELPRAQLGMRRPWRALRALRALRSELRARDYDLAVDFHSVARSSALAWAAGIPVRVGYAPPMAREGGWRLLTHRLRLPDPHVSRFERNAALVRFLGGEVPDAPPALELASDADAGLADLPGEFVLVHPGTSPKTLYKRWPEERFADVIRRLHQERQMPSVVAWGPVAGERERALRIVEAAGPGALLAPETRGISALLAILRRCRLLIGCDSGPIHLAALAGRPVVGIFGPTDPIENQPFPGLPSRVLRHDVGCNPCREGCPARSCMLALDAEPVARAALELIAGDSRRD